MSTRSEPGRCEQRRQRRPRTDGTLEIAAMSPKAATGRGTRPHDDVERHRHSSRDGCDMARESGCRSVSQAGLDRPTRRTHRLPTSGVKYTSDTVSPTNVPATTTTGSASSGGRTSSLPEQAVRPASASANVVTAADLRLRPVCIGRCSQQSGRHEHTRGPQTHDPVLMSVSLASSIGRAGVTSG